ncbi:Molybdopterin biosynthesis protein MoeA [invertebrate metagenome]|uniref:molybdopterin molybdotransferase n=1 Tax=invertebrate metagenome TaxID=1711999 RepID=A0A484H4K6_9ZZZZ
MISVQDARCRIMTPLRRLGAELVSLREAADRILAVDIAARITHPQAAVSAMDGYAVRVVDIAHRPVTLAVVAQSAAGHPAGRGIGPGEAVRIFTGAVIPAGADCILLQEDVETGPEKNIIVQKQTTTGSHIRPAGSDFKAGDVLLRAGRCLSFRDIALAAAMNVPWFPVVRRPRVAILSTGEEIRLPGESIGPGELIDSNGFGISVLIASHGGVAENLGMASDNRDSLLSLVEAARGADLLVITGGVSVGEYDLVREVLSEAGMILDFWKVAVRPGKPLMSGHLAGMPVLGLPGNPVSALVSAILFVLPALNTLLGLPVQTGAERQSGVLTCNLPANDSREDYLRAICVRTDDHVLHVTPFAQQDSAMQAILAKANCLAIRPQYASSARRGDSIDIIILESL